LPGLALSIAIDRLAFIPSRVLVRDMRFLANAASRILGEIVFPFVAVGLALGGHGGHAIVAANIARSVLRSAAILAATGFGCWLTPCRLSVVRTRAVLAFGLPNGVASVAAFAARCWDRLIVARLFGPGEVGMYQLAYNLSDIPSNQVGEHVADVLFPSFARLPPRRRRPALERALRILGLVMFPLSIGLGIVAPTLVSLALSPEWAGVAPRVSVLAVLSAAYPIGFVMHSYLNAADHPRWVMALGLFRLAVLLAAMTLLGLAGGPLGACLGVGVAFAAYSAASLVVASRLDRAPAWPLFRALLPPLVACAPMALAILLLRLVLGEEGAVSAWIRLALELAVGAGAFVGAALRLAPGAAGDFLRIAADTVHARRRR
jgi:PST family polysaccharide transporter